MNKSNKQFKNNNKPTNQKLPTSMLYTNIPSAHTQHCERFSTQKPHNIARSLWAFVSYVWGAILNISNNKRPNERTTEWMNLHKITFSQYIHQHQNSYWKIWQLFTKYQHNIWIYRIFTVKLHGKHSYWIIIMFIDDCSKLNTNNG